MAVLSWASIGTWWKEGVPSAAPSLGALLWPHQLQCKLPTHLLAAQGACLKLVKQVLPTHWMPRTDGYPQRGRNMGTREDFLGCTMAGHERVVIILQNTPFGGGASHFMGWAQRQCPFKTGFLKSKPKTCLWEEHESRSPHCLSHTSSKAPCAIPRAPLLPPALLPPLPLPTTI